LTKTLGNRIGRWNVDNFVTTFLVPNS